MTDQAQLLPGTLDLLILRAVSLGPLHGYGILLRIGQISGNALLIEQGALYPGLFRLVRQGLLKASWGTSENNRRAKFYELTAAGRKRLREETANWNRLATAIGSALASQSSCRSGDLRHQQDSGIYGLESEAGGAAAVDQLPRNSVQNPPAQPHAASERAGAVGG